MLSPFAVIPKASKSTKQTTKTRKDKPKQNKKRKTTRRSAARNKHARHRGRETGHKKKKKELTLTIAVVIERSDEGLGERAVATTGIEPPIGTGKVSLRGQACVERDASSCADVCREVLASVRRVGWLLSVDYGDEEGEEEEEEWEKGAGWGEHFEGRVEREGYGRGNVERFDGRLRCETLWLGRCRLDWVLVEMEMKVEDGEET